MISYIQFCPGLNLTFLYKQVIMRAGTFLGYATRFIMPYTCINNLFETTKLNYKLLTARTYVSLLKFQVD